MNKCVQSHKNKHGFNEADRIIVRMEEEHGIKFIKYYCNHCSHYHIARKNKKNKDRPRGKYNSKRNIYLPENVNVIT